MNHAHELNCRAKRVRRLVRKVTDLMALREELKLANGEASKEVEYVQNRIDELRCRALQLCTEL